MRARIDDRPVVSTPGRVRARSPHLLLAAVCLLHAALPLLLLGVHWWFGIDETVYLSQINAHVPAGLFSAPRARGETLLAAPVTLLTTSVAAVRVWVSALSGLAMYLAFRPWLRLYPGRYVVPLAALLLTSLWTVTYYGFEVMPNEWDGFCVLAATGFVVQWLLGGGRLTLLWAGIALALAALFRPSDALYATVALAIVALVGGRTWRRRLAAVGAVALGALAGAAEWLIEAEVRYGGIAARVHGAQAENGGSGMHFAGLAQARAVAGPLLCRNGCVPPPAAPYALWWAAVAVLVVVALVAAVRHDEQPLPLAALLVTATALAGEYVFTVTYAAPRFLIPAYTLVALPVAVGAVYLTGMLGRQGRPAVVGILAVGFLGHAALQAHVITARIAPTVRVSARTMLAQAAALHRAGVVPPCVVLGAPALDQNIAYAMRCADLPGPGPQLLAKLRAGVDVAYLGVLPPRLRAWSHWRAARIPAGRHGRTALAHVTGRSARGSDAPPGP